MAAVVGISLVGSAYVRGRRVAGHGLVELDSGPNLYVSEADCIGFEGCLRVAEMHGHETKSFRANLRKWVKTGKWPKKCPTS